MPDGLDSAAGELLTFRVGVERFAMAVGLVDAVSDMPAINPLPSMPPHMLGVCELRGSLIPVYSPAAVLNVVLNAPLVAIIAWVGRTGVAPGRRVAIAVDEAESVSDTHGARWSGIGGAPGSDGFVRGVSTLGEVLTTLVDADDFLRACAGSGACVSAGIS
jgi:purine-binding chemotaxis protein CheW